MEIRSNNLIDSLVSQRFGQAPYASSARSPAPASAKNEPQTPQTADTISLSRDLVPSATNDNASALQTRLLREVTEPVERGYRRTQTFERADGRTFTRVEEFTASDRNARRTVIQQNASGNTTRLDEVFERQGDGAFRRTQRFTDEAGDTTTQIQTNYVSADPFVLSGGTAMSAPRTQPGAFQSLRGTQLDLQA